MPSGYAKLTNCKRNHGQMVNVVNDYYLTSHLMLSDPCRNETPADELLLEQTACRPAGYACPNRAMGLSMRPDFAAMRALKPGAESLP